MKKLLLVLLLIHIVLESLVGFTLVFSPTTLVPTATGGELSGLIVQGMCGLSAVILALWLIPYLTHIAALTVGLGSLASFHSLLILSLFFTAPKPEELVGYTHHLILALGFWFCWWRRQSLADH